MATLDNLSLQLRAAMEERQKQRLLDDARRQRTTQDYLSSGLGMSGAIDAATRPTTLDTLNEMQSAFHRSPMEPSFSQSATEQPAAKKAGKSKRGAPGGKAAKAMTAKKVEPPAPKERIEVPDEGWRAEQMLYDLRSRVGRDVRDKDPATMDLERRLKEKAGLK